MSASIYPGDRAERVRPRPRPGLVQNVASRKWDEVAQNAPCSELWKAWLRRVREDTNEFLKAIFAESKESIQGIHQSTSIEGNAFVWAITHKMIANGAMNRCT